MKLPSTACVILILAFFTRVSLPASFWAAGGAHADGSNHVEGSTDPLSSTTSDAGSEPSSGLPSDAQTVTASGNGGSGAASYSASPGVLKATAFGVSLTYGTTANPDAQYSGGGGGQAHGNFSDTITINTDGFYQFSWSVLGMGTKSASSGFYGNGDLLVQRSDFSLVGRIQYGVGDGGGPVFSTPTSFLTFASAGTVLLVNGAISVGAFGSGGGSGSIDYGNSAYTVVEPVFGPGSFTAASGASYTVPEPGTLAMGLTGSVLLFLAKRRRS